MVAHRPGSASFSPTCASVCAALGPRLPALASLFRLHPALSLSYSRAHSWPSPHHVLESAVSLSLPSLCLSHARVPSLAAAPSGLLIRRRPLLYAGRRRPPFSSSSPAPMSISPPTAVSASPPGPQRCRMARVSRPASPAAAVQEREAYAALTPGPAAAESWHASLASPMDGAVGARGLC